VAIPTSPICACKTFRTAESRFAPIYCSMNVAAPVPARPLAAAAAAAVYTPFGALEGGRYFTVAMPFDPLVALKVVVPPVDVVTVKATDAPDTNVPLAITFAERVTVFFEL
jgi:hypothetical protein